MNFGGFGNTSGFPAFGGVVDVRVLSTRVIAVLLDDVSAWQRGVKPESSQIQIFE